MIAPLVFALACTAAPEARGDGWAGVLKAARLIEAAPSSPVLDRVRAQRRGLDALFDAEVSESFQAVRAIEPALAALDAAAVAPLCATRHAMNDNTRAAVLSLAEHALAAAIMDGLLDARERRSSARAIAGVGRALSLAMIAERCAAPPFDGLALALDIHARARFVAWHLAEQRTIDARDLASLADQMAASANTVSMERAVLAAGAARASLAEQGRVQALGQRIDEAARERALLLAAAGAFDAIARPAAFDPFAVPLVCAKAAAPSQVQGASSYVVSRSVERALELRGPELIGADSQVTPLFDGRGVEITRAGSFARSCGFADGDLLVEVNGVLTARGDAMVAVPQQVARDGHASFRVVRAGDVVEWRIAVEGKR